MVAKKDGKYAIVEYSELSHEHQRAVCEDGLTLKFRHGSILVFVFEAKALLDLALDKQATSLYHKAFKKVEHCDLEKMEIVKPDKENAWKFELFI